MAYSQFMNLKSILIGFQYGFSKAENKELYHTDFETIWGTELKVHQSKAFENIVNLSLYGNINIADQCNVFTCKYQNIDEQNFDEATADLNETISLMRKDLGIH